MKRKAVRQSGSTLLELLVGLVLLGLMTGLLTLVMPLGITAAQRAGKTSDQVDALRSTHRLLRRQIAEMPPITFREAHEDKLLFAGAEDRMRFPVYPLAARLRHAPRMVELVVEKRRGDVALLYGYDEERRILTEGARAVRFSYFGRTGPDTPAAWQPIWKKPDRLPQLIRISVDRKAGEQPWPDLVIAPMTQRPPR